MKLGSQLRAALEKQRQDNKAAIAESQQRLTETLERWRKDARTNAALAVIEAAMSRKKEHGDFLISRNKQSGIIRITSHQARMRHLWIGCQRLGDSTSTEFVIDELNLYLEFTNNTIEITLL